MTSARKAAVGAWLALALLGCGDDPPQEPLRRVGEPCQRQDQCEEGLACLAGTLRCVVLCQVGSDDCGEGIACEPAGAVGFCPLPPEG